MTGIVSGYSANVQNNVLVKRLLAQLNEANQLRGAALDTVQAKPADTATKNAGATDGENTKAQASGCACGLSRNGCSKKCKMIKAYNKH